MPDKIENIEGNPEEVFIPMSIYEPWMDEAIKHMLGDKVKINKFVV